MSTPLRIPPDTTSCTLPVAPSSSIARRAVRIDAISGMPQLSSWYSGAAAVAPSVPSRRIASQPVLTAILTSNSTRQAASFRKIGTW